MFKFIFKMHKKKTYTITIFLKEKLNKKYSFETNQIKYFLFIFHSDFPQEVSMKSLKVYTLKSNIINLKLFPLEYEIYNFITDWCVVKL